MLFNNKILKTWKAGIQKYSWQIPVVHLDPGEACDRQILELALTYLPGSWVADYQILSHLKINKKSKYIQFNKDNNTPKDNLKINILKTVNIVNII